jgi:hypothetical protein
MAATLDIKRNALSSRWCVWATEAGDKAAVENLLGEFKTRGEAEAFREHVSSGSSPEAALAAMKEKADAEKAGGKSLFGKFRKKGDAAAPAAVNGHKRPSNQVIQIQKHAPPAEEEEVSDVMGAGFEPPAPGEKQGRSSIRYEVIEPARKPRAPRVEDRAEAQEETEAAARVEAAPLKLVSPEAADEEEWSQPAHVEQPAAHVERVEAVEEEKAPAAPRPQLEDAPDHKAVRMISRVKARDIKAPASPVEESEEAPARRDGHRSLVNWTFTPPPDVSADEVKPHGKKAHAEEKAAKPAEEVSPLKLVVEDIELPPVKEQLQPVAVIAVSGPPAAAPAPRPQPQPIAQPPVTAQPAAAAVTGKVTIDICTARSLQNEAWGDPNIPDKKYNSIASKEYTEVSKAMANGASPEHLREELVHLASVCIAWADAIDKRLASQEENAA